MIIYLQIGLSITKTVESKKTSILGSIIGTILPSLIQLFLISMLINFLLPLFMGRDELIPPTYLSGEWWRIFKAGLFEYIMLIAFIPIIGEMASNTPGVSIFIIGMETFHRIAGSSLHYIQQINGTNIDIKPEFRTIICFIILTWIIVWLFTLVIVLILTSLNIISANLMQSGNFFLGLAIGVIIGLLTLSVYISYVL
jgi:hypothetical protein